MKIRIIASLLLLASVTLFTGCPEKTTISRIDSDPARFRNKEVLVVGEVTNSFGALGQGAYELSDETGKIWVITRRGVPSKGARVGSIGKYMHGVTWGGRNFGSAIQETDRKVR
ncbi:MAG: hypothetical protein SF339_12860 [Blastocatellia bacterium]|nr:hypothetical protein [Blastocatellia bacterium]